MISKQDELISEASATAFQLSQEEMIRLQCQAREDYYRRQRSVQHMLATQEKTINEQKETINDQKQTIKNQNIEIEKNIKTIQNLTDNNTTLQNELISLQKQLSDALAQIKK